MADYPTKDLTGKTPASTFSNLIQKEGTSLLVDGVGNLFKNLDIYVVSSSFSSSLSSGTVASSSISTTSSYALIALTSSYSLKEQSTIINVTDYGVDNTGATNSITAFQTAFNRKNKVIYIPSGSYMISGSITVQDGCIVQGDGPNNTIIIQSGSSYTFNILSASNVTIENLTVRGQRSISGQAALVSIGSTNIHFRNCVVDTIGDFGIYFNSTNYGSAEKCTIKHVGYTTGSSACTVYTSNYITIKNCYVFDTDYCGINVQVSTGSKIINNIVSGSSTFGIHFGDTCTCTCEGNSVYGVLTGPDNGNGFNLHRGVGDIINNNQFKWNGNGITINGTPSAGSDPKLANYIVVSNNVCTNNNRYGILFLNTENCLYSDNISNNNGWRGLTLYGDRDSTATGGETMDNGTVNLVYYTDDIFLIYCTGSVVNDIKVGNTNTTGSRLGCKIETLNASCSVYNLDTRDVSGSGTAIQNSSKTAGCTYWGIWPNYTPTSLTETRQQGQISFDTGSLYVWTDDSVVKTINLNNTSSYSTSASYSISASYALNSATGGGSSTSSSYASNSLSSSYAISASCVLRAITSDFALLAGNSITSTSASYALTSSYSSQFNEASASLITGSLYLRSNSGSLWKVTIYEDGDHIGSLQLEGPY